MTKIVSKGGLMHTIFQRIRALKSLLSHPFSHGEKSRGKVGKKDFLSDALPGARKPTYSAEQCVPVLMRFLSMQACQAHAKAQQ